MTVLDRFVDHRLVVADHDFIVGQQHMGSRHPPCEIAAVPVSFDRRDGDLFSPGLELALPVRDQWLGADQQYAPHLSGPQQEPQRL